LNAAKPLRVAVVVLNWQGWRDTLNCLNAVKSLTFNGEVSLIACDNASQDNSYTRIIEWAHHHYSKADIHIYSPATSATAAQLPAFTFLQTHKNLGFAGGMNAALRYLQDDTTLDYVWLLNNDISFARSALSHLCQCAEQHPTVGLWGSTFIDFYQRDIVQCAGGCRYNPLLTWLRPVQRGRYLSQVMQIDHVKLDYVYGAALFLRMEALRKTGFLNEAYFLFYEELDYTQRLRQNGYTIAWCKNSWVYHKGSATIGKPCTANRQQIRHINYHENLSTLKYTANFYPYWLLLIMLLRFVLKAGAVSWRGEWDLLPPLWAAYRDFMRGM